MQIVKLVLKVEQSTDNGASFTEIADLAANSNFYAVTGLDPATVYTYRVLAYNDFGQSAYSANASAQTHALECANDSFADSDLAVSGSVSGNYTLTHNSDNQYQIITEEEIKGKTFRPVHIS